MAINVTSGLLGLTSNLQDLIGEVEKLGWKVVHVKFDKKSGNYVAKARSFQEEVEKTGNNEKRAVSNLLIAITKKHYMRTAAQWKVGMWSPHNWVDQLQPIAEAYSKANIYDPKAAAAFHELGQDSVRRYNALKQHLNITETDDPEPYRNAQEMIDDITKRRRYQVSRANSDHPIWDVPTNVAFRAVHDILGHAVSGGNFDWQGENAACFPAGTLIRTLDGYRPIEEIQIGDKVLSANGEFNAVYHVMQREYEGEVVALETTSTVEEIVATVEHPFLRLEGNHGPNRIRPCMPGWCKEKRGIQNHSLEWTDAKSLNKGDWIGFGISGEEIDIRTVTIPKRYRGRMRACSDCQKNRGQNGPCAHKTEYLGPTEFRLTPDFLWAIGLYLAEGSGKDKLIYSLHINEEEYQGRLVDLFTQLGYKVFVNPHNENGCEVTVNSRMLGKWFSAWLGSGCQNKNIPNELWNLPNEKLVHIIRGIFDGDGAKKTGVLGQTSKVLALQVVEASARLGMEPTTYTHQRVDRKRAYFINEIIRKNHRGKNSVKKGVWNINGYPLRQITKINKRPFKGTVYNLSVKNHGTYIVQNIAVHNCAAHLPLLSENAQKALFSECIGQTAYGAYYKGFGPQKVVHFPQFIEPVQQRENASPGYAGVHPSQSFPPVATPAVKPEVYEPEYPGIPPHLDGLGLANYVPGTDTRYIFGSAKFSSPFTDPNANWTSGFTPMVPNAYLDHGDPLESQAVSDNARLIDTEWSKLNQDDPGDLALMKQAIVNAFRVVLLSPLKNLKHNAIHYQDISGIPGDVSDPGVYWNTLENARQNHNVKYFGEEHRFDHMVYAPFVKPFESIIYQMNPSIGWQRAQKKAKQIMFDWQSEEQQRISAEDKDKPEEKRRLGDEIDRRANEALAKRLQMYIKEFQPKLDFTSAVQDSLFEPPQPVAVASPERYPAFIGNHLKSISQVSGHVNDILKAALEDVHNHDGAGHHFRAAVMQLGISGVGPKVCSFAWLLLQPMTSQLGTIDTHMVDALGHNYQTDMNNRDYFKMERELAAGRDAAGYEHVPLGQFQWGMWDLKRSGQGTHSDHSALKVLNPTPHDAIDWATKMTMPRGESWQKIAPDWWRNTQPFRDAVADDWDKNIAPHTPQNQIPYGASDPTYQYTSSTKLAEPMRSPWFTHPETGLHTIGTPGHTIMQHATQALGLSTPQVWDALQDSQDGTENAGKS